MAFIFTNIAGTAITIGGTTTTGPFPKYSLGRELIRTGDDTVISCKYNIAINGRVITDSSASILVAGEMQSNLHSKVIEKLQTDIALGHNIGRLQIVPYGGQPNTIEFLDARLVSIEIPEQNDDSSGILYSEYSFTFEAYEDISNIGNGLFPFALNSVEESWEISVDDSETIYDINMQVPSRTYAITHNISATGRKKFNSGPNFNSSAWKQACDWVKTRLVSNPASAIVTDAVGRTEVTSFTASLFDNGVSTASTDLSGMTYYNHIRTPNCDINNGTYSVTETWKASDQPALVDMEINVEQDESQALNITLTGTITGLDKSVVNTKAIDRIANAEIVLKLIDATAFNLCNAYYSSGRTLQNVIRAKSIGRNKGTGVITFSYTFNDTPIIISGAQNTTLQITDDNEYQLNKIVAIIMIISKTNGPIIQDMNTTPERKRSVQIDAVMGIAARTTKPATGITTILSYAPDSAYLQSLVETWEPNTGSYTINAEWVY